MSFSRVTSMPAFTSAGCVLAAVIAIPSLGGPAIAAATQGAGGPGGAGVVAKPDTTSVTWGACGWRTSNEKIVRTFTRVRGDDRAGHVLTGGTSRLLCGDEGAGYRHILEGKRGQWERDGAIGGTNWRDHADWSTDVVLNDPDAVTYRMNKRTGKANFCCSREVELWDRGHRRHVTDRIIRVALKADTADIITAYPTDHHCKVANEDQ